MLEKFNIYQKVFIILGFLFSLSPIFWLIHTIAYYSNKKRIKFFDYSFFKINYIFGITVLVSILIGFLFNMY